MVSPSGLVIFRMAGWAFIPGSVTQGLLSLMYRFSRRFPGLLPFDPSLPNTPAYRAQYRYTYAFVVLMYLIYTLVEGALTMEPNFYELLGVAPGAEEGTLKLAFRQFARRNHPDKIARGATGARREEVFIAVKDAFQALKDPVVRFAYDRFGPDVLKWTGCTTTREYLHHGLMQSSGYHIVTGVFLLLFSAIGKPNPVAFWRYILFVSLLASELALLLAPSPSAVTVPSQAFSFPAASPTYITPLHTLFPQRVAYQHVRTLHQFFVFLSIALSQVAPQLFPSESLNGPNLVERLRAMVGIADREASIMLHAELHSIHPASASHVSLTHMKPFTDAPSEEVVERLTEEMQNMLIEMNLKKDSGPLKSAWEGAVCNRADSAEESDNSQGLPSPVSPGGTPRQKEAPLCMVDPGDILVVQGRLPSPRPSPPPFSGRSSSYVRARRISC